MSIEVESTMTTRQTIALAQVIPQYRQTLGKGRRRLLTPDEVLRLPNTELLVVIRGCSLLKLNKLDYTRHPMSAGLEEASIMDYHPQVQASQTGKKSLSTDETGGTSKGTGAQESWREGHREEVRHGNGTCPEPGLSQPGSCREEDALDGTVHGPPPERNSRPKKLYGTARPPEAF